MLEAVDTSFHFETAAAERKRMNDSGLGPLEIDCSDTGSEASCNISNKRKFSEMDSESNKKKCKESNNLLKTASPGSALKSGDHSGVGIVLYLCSCVKIIFPRMILSQCQALRGMGGMLSTPSWS